jgi:opacity protein-like surface antigen
MRKTILTVLGTALIVASSVQFADAARRHHGKTDRAVISQQQQSRNADAYAAWPAPAAQSDWATRYSGGYSAPAGH